jgi:hypothetical protein
MLLERFHCRDHMIRLSLPLSWRLCAHPPQVLVYFYPSWIHRGIIITHVGIFLDSHDISERALDTCS